MLEELIIRTLCDTLPEEPADALFLFGQTEDNQESVFAKERQYRRVIVTASPFQQPRAYMAAVTAALRSYPELYIYSLPGKALPWKEEVVHSQGKVQDARAGLIAGEMERIRKYHAIGDMVSVDKVIAYLNRRDLEKL